MAHDADEFKGKTKKAVDDAVDVVDKHVPVKIRPHAAILVPAVIGAFVLALMTWAAGEIYEAVTDRNGLSLLDQPVLDSMVAHRQPWLNVLFGAFTQIGGPIGAPLIASVVVIWMSLRWHSWLPVTLMLAAAIGSVTVTVVGKNYIDRIRPPHEFAIPPFESSPSFPSGHSLNAVVLGGIVAYLLWRRFEGKRTRALIVVLAVVYALAMGLSRVYLGHHWLTDVITGWLLGAAWLALVITAHMVADSIKTRRSNRDAVDAPGHPRGELEG